MKKKLSKTLSLFMALALVFALSSFLPEGVLRAKALGNISGLDTNYTHKYISWDKYDGADYYKFEVEATGFAREYKLYTERFEYADVFTKKGIVYYYSVTAMDSSGTALSRAAKSYYYDYAEITGLKVDAKTLTVSWDAFTGDFDYYSVNVSTAAGGSSGHSVDKSATSTVITMNDQPSGTYKVWIDARKKDGTYSFSTGRSGEVSFDYTSTAKHITSTAATVPTAYIGEHPQFTAGFVLNDGELDVDDCIESYEVRWINSSDNYLKDTDVFEEGKSYKLWVIVHLKDNVYMDYETWVHKYEDSSVNGIATYMQNLGGLVVYVLEVSITPKQPLKAIEEVNITLTEPVAGERSNSKVTITPSTVKAAKGTISSNKCTWYNGDAEMGLFDKFKEGETYTASFNLIKSNTLGAPDPTYVTSKTKVLVNGKEATFKEMQGSFAVFTAEFTAWAAALPGDADVSGTVDIMDVMLMQQYIAKWNVNINIPAADVDGDNLVTITDVMLVQQKIAGWGVVLV